MSVFNQGFNYPINSSFIGIIHRSNSFRQAKINSSRLSVGYKRYWREYRCWQKLREYVHPINSRG